jgi:transposase
MSGDAFSRRYSIIAETRRQWSETEKQSIVAEAERPGANISAVARRHGIKPSLLFRWRRLAREVQARPAAPAFVPVTLALPPACAEPPASEACSANSSMAPVRSDTGQSQCDDRIEIELGNGRLVRVATGVDTDVLRRIVDLLDQPSSDSEAAGRRQKR